MEEATEKKCPVCGAVLEGVPLEASGEYDCRRCGTRGRYEERNLAALFIKDYHARLRELESLNKEILADIELESMKGEFRDMRYLREKHMERQGVLAEYSFLSHFRPFIENW